MKRIKNILLLSIVFGGGLWVGSLMITNALGLTSNSQPGSVDDPIVTKSYVEQQVRILVQQEMAGHAINNDHIQLAISSEIAKLRDELQGTTGGQSGLALEIDILRQGQTIFAGAGSEIIVRNGKTVAVSTDGNGIPNVTSGVDIQHGGAIPTNHLLIFPREGRGVTTANDNDAAEIYMMIRGSYTIFDTDGNPIQKPN
jgi:hypothetical protein